MRSEDLLGSRVVLSVGEPWDFESADGQNVLFGEIAAVSELDTPVLNQRVEFAVTPFIAEEGSRVDRLVARERYCDEVGIVLHLLAGSRLEVDLHYDEQVRLEQMPEGVRPFLRGGIHLRWHDVQRPRSQPWTFTLYEQGALAKDLPEYGLRPGDIGTVVHVYADEVAYEVEFRSPDGRSVEVITVGAGNLLSAS